MAVCRATGWTWDTPQFKHYCLAHTIAHKCLLCSRYMRPQRRLKADFPDDWVTASRLKRESGHPMCHSCERSLTNGSLAEQTRALDRAEQRYLEAFPALAEFVAAADETDREELARKAAPQDLWLTLGL